MKHLKVLFLCVVYAVAGALSIASFVLALIVSLRLIQVYAPQVVAFFGA